MTTPAREDVEQGEYSSIPGESTILYYLFGSQCDFSEKLGLNLPQDPAILLLSIRPKDTQSYHRDTFSTTFIAALFVIERTLKQPRYPSTEEWIKKMWYIHTVERYSAF